MKILSINTSDIIYFMIRKSKLHSIISFTFTIFRIANNICKHNFQYIHIVLFSFIYIKKRFFYITKVR